MINCRHFEEVLSVLISPTSKKGTEPWTRYSPSGSSQRASDAALGDEEGEHLDVERQVVHQSSA